MGYPVTLRSMQTIFPSDSEGTKWTKLCANIKEAVTAAAISVPADLTPINSCDSEGTKWYKLGRWLALIAGGGTPGQTTGVGYYTPLELLASRNIVDADAGKWLFNTGGAKTLTLTGSQGLEDYGFDGTNPQGPITLTNGPLGSWSYSEGTPGSPWYIPEYNSWVAGNGAEYYGLITVTQPTYITWHADKYQDSASYITFDDGTPIDTRTAGLYLLSVGTHKVAFTGNGNARIDGFAVISTPTPGPMNIGESLQIFQTGSAAITIAPGGNTLVAPGLTTKGAGSWAELKKIGDNLYHAHGDLA